VRSGFDQGAFFLHDQGIECGEISLVDEDGLDDLRPALPLFGVADDGGGMSPEVKEALFTQFFSTKGSAGTGLGLLVTKKIVEEHGGQIAVESEQGQGTTFTVMLPAGEAKAHRIGS